MNRKRKKSSSSGIGPKLGQVMFICIMLWLLYLWACLPDVRHLKKFNPGNTVFMEYRLAVLKKTENNLVKKHHWVALDRISPVLIRSVLIAEDDKFYLHSGFDWESIRQSLEKNLVQKRMAAGGSTITQQLAKNLYLTPRKNILRKINEALITIKLEKALSKKRILEIYLNIIEWGKGIFGVEAAARHYYNKPAAMLNIPESIRLASVLPNPVRFSPLGNNSKRMVKKREAICMRLFKRGYISETQYLISLREIK